MQTYLQALFRAEPGVDDALAERLATRANKAIHSMRVWDATPLVPTNEPAAKTTHDKDTKSGQPVAKNEPAFDPYAFSAMVVFAKKGGPALLKKLEAIDNPADLKALADAQHIGLKGRIETIEQLRAAIVEGAKQRLADRRAAAS